ncbi:hypothetical protein INT43_003514 [Umbelopsis isabellina]|uniref:Uncharacterized protein n=1 Tax=Mortierella isabellina TaxID=91625 RepID=A0A8H7PS62_MORIS|nr:hypothetical protein INT43_003514 [Umbelopsis isabellina]
MRALSFGLLATAVSLGNVLGSAINDCAQVANSSIDLYTYTFPLVLMQATSNQTAQDGLSGVITQDPSNHLVVKINLDTSYVQGFFNLEKYSYTLTVPNHGSRYWIAQYLDAYSNTFADPGNRTLEDKPYTFGLIGPKGHRNFLPKNATVYESPTDMAWILGRVYQNGTTTDQEIVTDLIKQWVVTKYPLHSSKPISVTSTPIANGTAPSGSVAPLAAVTSLTTQEFFDTASQLMCDNQPAHADKKFLQKMSKDLGFKPCSKEAFKKPNFVYSCLLPNFTTTAVKTIAAEGVASAAAIMHDGWPVYTSGIGAYGTNFIFRAVVALVGLGANLAEDAVYPSATKTAAGVPLNTSQAYTLTFQKGDFPPVDAFWSITYYNAQNYLQPNTANVYALRSADPFTYNSNGSLTIFVQANAPSNSSFSKNWLPSQSNGTFTLTLRLYNPQQAILNGSWVPPPIIQSAQPI